MSTTLREHLARSKAADTAGDAAFREAVRGWLHEIGAVSRRAWPRYARGEIIQWRHYWKYKLRELFR